MKLKRILSLIATIAILNISSLFGFATAVKQNSEQVKKITKIQNKKNNKKITKKNKSKKNEKNKTTKQNIPNENLKIKTYELPLKLNTNDELVKIIYLQAMYEELINSKILDKEKLGIKNEKNNMFDKQIFYDILTKENDDEKLKFIANSHSEEEYLEKTLKSKKVKDFVKNFSLDEEKFNKTKEKILKMLEEDKKIIEQNINNFKNKKLNLKVYGFADDDKNLIENDKKLFYEKFTKPFLKKYDKKLYDKIEEKLDQQIFMNSFFEDAVKKAKEKEIYLMQQSLDNFTNKDGFINKIKNLKYDEKFKDVKVNKIDDPKNQNFAHFNKGSNIAKLAYEEMKNFELNPNNIILGYIEALDLDDEKKEEFKKYYEEKIKEEKNKNVNDAILQKEAKEYIKSITKKDSLDDKENNDEKNINEVANNLKNTKINYFEYIKKELENNSKK